MAGDVARSLDLLGLVDGDAARGLARRPRPRVHPRTSLPAIRAWSDIYFRAEVEGLEEIPADEPVLLVGNHSGGTLIADTFVLLPALLRPLRRRARASTSSPTTSSSRSPACARACRRFGTVPANPDNMREALDRGAALLVYPGGDHETYRPSWEQDQIDFAGRTGFVKLALELGTPIVPVVAIGGQETALFLGQGRRISRALGLDRALRLKVFPVQVAPPFGVTLLDLPLRMPLPSKITIRVLPRIDLREELGADADPRDAYELVTEAHAGGAVRAGRRAHAAGRRLDR